jgi:hypothetical protein
MKRSVLQLPFVPEEETGNMNKQINKTIYDCVATRSETEKPRTMDEILCVRA